MFNKLKLSLKNINYKLFIALLVMGLCPTIYTTLRVFWIGELPGEWSFSIAGQLSWVNLIYEVINEAIILPLFYFIGKVILDKKELTNRIKTGLLISLVTYFCLSVLIIIFAGDLLLLMAASPNIIEASISYIRIEAIANIFIILFNFILVSLITLGKDKYVYILTVVKLVLSIVIDVFLLSNLSVSFNLGVNGIAYSNIIVNLSLFIVSIFILYKEGIDIFNKEKLSFSWIKEFVKVGGISGLESFVRNLFYMVMISRMVNVVGEQGTYWVANNFIWGWLLLPVIQLGELIKQETATNKESLRKNTLGYFFITTCICLLWVITIPLYKPFMGRILNFTEVDKLFNLVMVLLVFYMCYAFQNIFDSTFYGLGKTNYMLFESVVTNIIYYGVCFILYITNVFKPSLLGIAIMFGIGNLFYSIVSLVVYLFLLKKESL
jgi:Na+-driven multidrug efflux pump